MRAFDASAADLLRDLAPRVLGALVRRCGDFATAEDAVQEALVAGFTQWPGNGVPDNPGGWLYHAAVRWLVDRRRSEAARARREARAELPILADPPEPDELLLAGDDDTLALMFMCCHPALSRESAVALTLRAVGGLVTGAIARAFLVSEATMGQRISWNGPTDPRPPSRR